MSAWIFLKSYNIKQIFCKRKEGGELKKARFQIHPTFGNQKLPF